MTSERINKDTPLSGINEIQRVPTSAYPTRYAAQDHPGKFVVLTADGAGLIHPAGFSPQPAEPWLREPGRELVVFAEGMANRDFPKVSDGIFVEIIGQTRLLGGFTMRCHASTPTRSRSQKNLTQQCRSLPEALTAAETWIQEARLWIAQRVRQEQAVVLGGEPVTLRVIGDDRFEILRGMNADPVARVVGGEVEILDLHRVFYGITLEAFKTMIQLAIEHREVADGDRS